MSLDPGVKSSYAAIIDGILATSDLQTISAKRIRTGLEAAVQHDLAPYKDEIKALILERFDKKSSQAVEPVPPVSSPVPPTVTSTTAKTPTTNGAQHKSTNHLTNDTPRQSNTGSEELSDVIDDPRPKKKVKRAPTSDDDQIDDATFAARLQAEENSRARPTRGGATRKRPPVKKKVSKKKKEKSSKRVNSDDDVDANSGSEEKEVKRTGAFHKPLNLSAPLADLLGETTLSRPQTVKKVWQYVRANNLQNPEDKRQIICDERMRAVFKQESVHMFTMNKILANNLYPVED